MIPIENSVAGRVADIHHLMPGSGLHIVGEISCRCSISCWRCTGATLDDDQDASTATSMRSASAATSSASSASSRGRRRHRGRRARGRRSRRPDPRRARVRAGGRDLRPATSCKTDIEDAKHNTTRFLVLSREPKWAPAGNGRVDHHLRLPGAQHAGRALQGDGRLRHQRRQHDQAGKLHGRRQLHRHAVLCRVEGHPRIARSNSRWRNWISSRSRRR